MVTLLVGLNALYVAGEFSAVAARKTRLVLLAEEGNKIARGLLPVLEDPARLDRYIAASQVGITLSSITLGIYGQQQIAPRISPLISRMPILQGLSVTGDMAALGISATLVLILLTTLQVIFGELIPKSVALRYPESVALGTALPMRWSADILLKPLIAVLNGSGVFLLRLLRVNASGEHTHIHSPEEIVILVKESHQGGLLDAEERRMLSNVFRVSETTAEAVAVPRNHLVGLDVSTVVSAALATAAESPYSRFPVYEEDLDHILGFVHIRDLYNLYRAQPDADLRGVVREAPFVPETLSALEVWERMNEARSYLAVVFDEYGGTTGMITREDLVEELFGELQDEFDQEPPLITRQGEGRILVRGEVAISTINDMLELNLPQEDFFTISGLLQDRLGRVPTVGDEIHVGDVRLRVEEMDGAVVGLVCMFLPYQEEAGV